ncbi:MAG: hypothetical protein WB729_16750 [Candidatus Sulfotelmatobacter sp.]
MNSSVLKYNPGFMRDEELLKNFVVRVRDLEWMLGIISANTRLEANQHILVVGARGSGKTTLVGRVGYEVRTSPDISRFWHPVMFSEETYAVSSPGEFWLEALFQIYNDTGDPRWKQIRDDLAQGSDDAQLRELALGHVLDYSDQLGKKLLLVVENLNMLLAQLPANSDWELRHTLLNERRIMLLGTATSKFSELENVDRAWFDLFTTHELKPLNTRDSVVLWRSYTGHRAPLRQVQALRILTGGNPRLFRILSEFAVKASFRELMENLTQLVDEHTEYFKGSLDSLSPVERKVFVSLLERWDPGDAREIAEAARMDVNKASALLLRLVERGRVTIVSSLGRKRKYQVAERLFNIYYLMRRRGRPADRVRAVVRFMVQFYRDDSLIDTVTGIAREARSLGPDQRENHYSAYAEVLRCVLDGRVSSKILKGTAPEFLLDQSAPLAIRRFGEINSVANVASMPEAVVLLRKALDKRPGDFELGLLLGGVTEQASGSSTALFSESTPSRSHDAKVWTWIAEKLHDLGLFEDALVASKKAVAADPTNGAAWRAHGELLWYHLGQDEEGKKAASRGRDAEAAFRKAIEMDPAVAWCYTSLATILRCQRRFDEAENEAKRALELDGNSEQGWAEFGAIKVRQHQFAEAEGALRRALQINANSAFLWGELGLLLAHDDKRADEAIAAYQHALRIDDTDWFASSKLVALVTRTGTDEKVRSTVDEFLGRLKYSPKAAAHVAWAVRRSDRTELFPRAIELVRSAMADAPDDWKLAHALASLLGGAGDWAAAIAAMPPAIAACAVSEGALERVTQFFISASANGHGIESLAVLEGRERIASLEPLVIGIRLYLGEHPVVAQEILDVGADVAKKIQDDLKMRPEVLIGDSWAEALQPTVDDEI